MKVLNEQLHALLQRLFRQVLVNRQGDPFRYRMIERDGRKSIESTDGGEVYVVHCPLCKDKKARLNIAHVFGMNIEGLDMNYVAHCWNCEGPISRWLWDQYQMFEAYGMPLSTATVIKQEGALKLSEVAEACAKDMLKLRGVSRLDTIPADSPALSYLIGRQYDPYKLASTYAVCYCATNQYEMRLANRRLIIPVIFGGRWIGWQARAIVGHTRLTPIKDTNKAWPYEEPKYWTSPGYRKSFFLYNHDIARRYDTGVIVEGSTSAWRVGECGVAIFGRRLSQHQASQIVETWGDGQIALIGDPGFEQDWIANQSMLEEMLGRKVPLYVDDKKDPGDMTTEEIWRKMHDYGVRDPQLRTS